MLVINLPFENLPQIKLSDKVHSVLRLMYDYQVQELAVVEMGEFKGIVKEETLLNADENLAIKELQHYFLNVSVNSGDHLLKAVSLAVASHLSILPVIDTDNKLAGIIETKHLLKDVSDFLELNEPGALIVLETDSLQYSFSEISRIVESNDAQVTQLNTSRDIESGKMQVTIKVNKLEVSDIVATFQRYEYHVKYYFGEELYTNELKNNYENLMSYLNV
ncbi:CBS domain-containing protein [Niabella ginsengisoli]|uniref:CBS domain-containing protein n=1 Tax=Niabella ginsengisoli TaxID=522298 RepID=A0ABS9SNA2_9BACT|nr:CBS domain-containing protein [Niabella ginsengisoli]MCH5599850.1 CBS domain-containing protein [Niabella ginsengisoli]